MLGQAAAVADRGQDRRRAGRLANCGGHRGKGWSGIFTLNTKITVI